MWTTGRNLTVTEDQETAVGGHTTGAAHGALWCSIVGLVAIAAAVALAVLNGVADALDVLGGADAPAAPDHRRVAVIVFLLAVLPLTGLAIGGNETVKAAQEGRPLGVPIAAAVLGGIPAVLCVLALWEIALGA